MTEKEKKEASLRLEKEARKLQEAVDRFMNKPKTIRVPKASYRIWVVPTSLN